MPTEEIKLKRYPDRRFFWGIALTIIPEWANLYIQEVNKDRILDKKKLPSAKTISITNNWLNRLKVHDYQS